MSTRTPRWLSRALRAAAPCLALVALYAAALTAPTFAAADEKREGEKAPGSWPFAEAMAHHRPLARVPGAPSSSLCENAGEANPRYRAAQDYAAEMGSYSLLIWRGGRCEFAHYFEPYDAALKPESASMHKTVAALLVAAAIADGHIDSADDPIGAYLAEWQGDPRGDITLEQIMHMASGLEPLSREGGLESDAWGFWQGTVDVRELLLRRPQWQPPGSRFHYSNFNTQLLLMALEAAVDEPYQAYLSRRLWQPLGAGDAHVYLYRTDPPMARAYSALMATADDWLRVGLLIKGRGTFAGEEILPASLVDAMTTPSPAYENYGWQLWLGNRYEAKRYYDSRRVGAAMAASEPYAVDDMIYLDGIGGQRVYISRSLDLVIVRLGDMRLDWDDSRLPNLVIRALGESS